MTNILYIKSSILGEFSQSSYLGQKFIDNYLVTHGDSKLVVRDLALNPVPHLTGAAIAGFALDAEKKNAEQAQATDLSNTLINELRAADMIVLGLPMYNFGLPSALKAWIDYVARAGETFRYSEQGPEGLLLGKKAYIFAARGGKYFGTDADTQTAYMQTILEFFGITDVRFVYAEGLAMGDEVKTLALAAATSEANALAVA